MVELHHTIEVDASPARVFEAIATSEGNAGWWTADSRIEPRAGTEAEFGFDRRAALFKFKVDRSARGKELALACVDGPPEWVGTTVAWSLARADGQTVVRMTHGGWKEASDYCASCNTMWGRLMCRLKAFVESGKAKPQWKR